MKFTLNDFMAIVKTKSEPSFTVDGLWMARSAVMLSNQNVVYPVFGFSSGFNRQKCEDSARYELLEHLAFIPDAHSHESANQKIIALSDKTNNLTISQKKVKEFLTGSKGPNGVFYGNGCAIHHTIQSAIHHARCELLERHLCCEIWYHRSRPLLRDSRYSVQILDATVAIRFFTTDQHDMGHLIIAALECEKLGFFTLGAAVRVNLEEAYQHALSEAVMLFEDAKKCRAGVSSTHASQINILSLRNRRLSFKRKQYFYDLVDKPTVQDKIFPEHQAIVFEAWAGLYATRAFASNALDPRRMYKSLFIPDLPLF